MTLYYDYYAYALTIRAELPFPELLPCTHPFVSPDVTVEWGEVAPTGLPQPVVKKLTFQADTHDFWLFVPGVARFLVRSGRQIIIDPIPGSDEDSIRVFLLGSCLGALLMQRGLLLLHGNVIQVGEKAVVFAGVSGAGKSTLAGTFYQRGYTILADDICAVTENGFIIPGYPQLKLWQDTATQLSIDTDTLRKIRPCINKYAFPLKNRFCTRPLALHGIYILNMHNQPHIHLEHLTGAAKLMPLRSQAYRPLFQQGIHREPQLQLRYAKLAHQLMLARVTRPNQGYTFNEIADRIESDWQKQSMNQINQPVAS